MMIKYRLYVAILLLLCGCGKGSSSGHYGGKDSTAKDSAQAAIATVPLKYNFFIENSPSMDGYVEGSNSGFKNILSSLASNISARLNTDPSVFFITDQPSKQTLNETASAFINSLTKQKLHESKRATDSQMDYIINLCMNGLDSNINILASDCIFSKKGADGILLDPKKAQDDLEIYVAKKLGTVNVAVVVLKYNSSFSGAYYSETNHDKAADLNRKEINRPFYILIFGSANNLQPLLSKIDLHYSGFEASYCLTPNKNAAKIDAAITAQNKIGNFSFQKPASSMVIYDASPGANGVFQFTINADLSKVSAEKDFLLHPSNYVVNDNFKVVDVAPVSGASNYTHTLTLMTTNLQQNHDLKIGLKYEPPDWVAKTGSMIDNNPTDTAQQHQTYGFQYLMQGISQGYIAKNGELQFIIPVTISKGNSMGANETSHFPWWILIAVVVVVGIVIWLKNKS